MWRVTAVCALAAAAGLLGCARDSAVPDEGGATTMQRPPAQAQSPVTDAEPAKPESLTVFAGAASGPALRPLAEEYTRRTGIKIDVTIAGSGTLLAQFTQERFGDVYVPGSDDFMDKAEAQDAVLPDTREVLVYLVPAICVAKSNPKNIKGLEDLARDDLRVVLAEPKAVCLGDVSVEILSGAGLWSAVEPRVASYAQSCESTINTLLLGESDVVIGWDVYGRQHPDEVECLPIDPQLGRPRNIPAAVIKWSTQPAAARAFVGYLASEDAERLWHQHGYPTEPPVKG